MSALSMTRRLERLEHAAEDPRSQSCRVVEGEPTADDLASGQKIIRIRYVDSPKPVAV